MARAIYPLPVALRLMALHRELNAQMDIRITEPVFFLGSDRKAGDVLRNVQSGPYRTQVIPGGLQRIPQFVEMAEQINQSTTVPPVVAPISPVAAAASVAAPAPGSFAEATAAVLKPAAPAAPVNRIAALLSGLATRRRKLEQTIIDQANDYAAKLGAIEQEVPEVFAKGSASLEDRKASLDELSESFKDLAGANGSDPLSD